MSLTVNEINDSGCGHAAVISDEDLELIVSLDYGPRIVSVKKGGLQNLIYNEVDEQYGRSHGHKMRITLERSTNGIYCDDLPVRYSPMTDGVRFVQTTVDPVALELTMDITRAADGGVMVVHSVLNKSDDYVKLSIYTETPFANNGFVFVPQSNVPETEKPGRILTLWHGVNWTDPRLHFSDQYICISNSQSEQENRLKLGSNNTAGWCGYTDGTRCFIKRYVHSRSALYPFYSCSTIATSYYSHMSIQTISPFYRIAPGESARHVEYWMLPVSGKELTASDTASLDDFINTI